MNPPAADTESSKRPFQELLDIAASVGVSYTDGSPPASVFVASNGLRVHCRDWGHADKPPVVFLHGTGMSAHTWDLVCLGLREDFHCIAVDARGHGETDGVHAFGVEVPRADLAGTIEGLSLNRPVLVGMHMGANDIVAYAGVHSAELAGAVFVDTCPTVSPAGYQEAMDYYDAIARSVSFDDAVEVAHSRNPRGNKAYQRWTLAHRLELFGDGRWHMRYERDLPPGTKGEEFTEYMVLRREQLWSLVPQIACPTLVIQAEHSTLQTSASLDQFCSRLPDAELVPIMGASGSVQEDQPVEFTAVLRTFLQFRSRTVLPTM